MISEHYGSAMRGFVRTNNPDKGQKLGEWELSRDEIVNQLASQGLEETQAGWITIRMRGEIPPAKGTTYFLVVIPSMTESLGLELLPSAKVMPINLVDTGFIQRT